MMAMVIIMENVLTMVAKVMAATVAKVVMVTMVAAPIKKMMTITKMNLPI